MSLNNWQFSNSWLHHKNENFISLTFLNYRMEGNSDEGATTTRFLAREWSTTTTSITTRDPPDAAFRSPIWTRPPTSSCPSRRSPSKSNTRRRWTTLCRQGIELNWIHTRHCGPFILCFLFTLFADASERDWYLKSVSLKSLFESSSFS